MAAQNEQELDKLHARLEFYDSCVDQLRKELPRYLSKQLEMDKSHKSIAKVLRNVASNETNQKLQNLIFLYSQKHELFDKERACFGACEKATLEVFNNAKNLQIAPLKEILADQRAVAKTLPAAPVQGSRLSSSSGKSLKNDISDAQFVQSTLGVHEKMFEKHRVQSMKKVLQGLVAAELRYHCRVVEELSLVLQDLACVDEFD